MPVYRVHKTGSLKIDGFSQAPPDQASHNLGGFFTLDFWEESEPMGNQGMSDTHEDFDLVVETPSQNNGPKTEKLDSGDYFNAPERHWLVRFSVVIFCIGLLAGASATTAASNQWITSYSSAICITLSASCVVAFFSVLWWITLRELKSHSKARAALARYRLTSLYFWCGLLFPFVVISVATYFLMYHKETY